MRDKILLFLCSFALFFCVTGCDGSFANETEFSFTDALGREVALNPPTRVVALFGSYAETWALAGGSLIGVTDDVFSETEFDAENAEIVGTVKNPNMEKVLSLSPDFVILSADLAAHVAVSEILTCSKIAHAYFRQETYEDYLFMLGIFTDLTGRKDLYEENGKRVGQVIDGVMSRIDSEIAENTRVLFVRARSQGVAAKASDHMVCDILNKFGCVNIAASDGSLLENLSMEQIIARDPDVILVTSMGDENAAKKYLTEKWESNPAWSGLDAVKNGRYVFLEKRLFHYKPNNRWGEAYERLQEILFG